MRALLARLGGRARAAVPLGELAPEVRRAVRIDVSATLLATLFVSLTGPFTGLILRRELGATPFQLALAPTAGAVCLLLSLLWVRAMAGRPPLPYVVWPGFAARALFLLVPFIHTAWPFVGILVAGQALAAVAGPAQAALVHGVYPREQRGRALGLVRMMGAVPGILLVLGAGRLLAAVGYRWVFPAAALLGMAAALRQRALPFRAGPAGSAPPPVGLREAWAAVRADRALRRLLAGSTLFGAGIWLQMPATPVLLADVLGVGTAQVGLFAATAGVAGLLANGVWGRLADTRGSLPALRAVYVVGLFTPLLYLVARSPWTLAAAAVTESLTHTGLDVIWMMAVIDVAGPRRITQYMAIGGTLAGVRGVLGPLAGAFLVARLGVHAVYLVAAATMAAAALVVSLQLRAAAPAAGRRLAPPVPTAS